MTEVQDSVLNQAWNIWEDLSDFEIHTKLAQYYSPMNPAVAHDNVWGPQTRAELRGHREQAYSWGPAGRVLTGSGATAGNETLHQTVELLQSI